MANRGGDAYSKGVRGVRFLQMSQQQQLIEEKKRKFLNKLQDKNKAKGDEAPATTGESSKIVEQTESKSSTNIFTNDGSFLDQFQKFSGQGINPQLDNLQRNRDRSRSPYQPIGREPVPHTPGWNECPPVPPPPISPQNIPSPLPLEPQMIPRPRPIDVHNIPPPHPIPIHGIPPPPQPPSFPFSLPPYFNMPPPPPPPPVLMPQPSVAPSVPADSGPSYPGSCVSYPTKPVRSEDTFNTNWDCGQRNKDVDPYYTSKPNYEPDAKFDEKEPEDKHDYRPSFESNKEVDSHIDFRPSFKLKEENPDDDYRPSFKTTDEKSDCDVYRPSFSLKEEPDDDEDCRPSFKLKEEHNEDDRPSFQLKTEVKEESNSLPFDVKPSIKQEDTSSCPDTKEIDDKAAIRERKRKSRWGEKAQDIPPPTVAVSTTVPTIKVTGMSGHLLTKVTRTEPGLLQYALQAYGTTLLSEEDWKKAEDNYKVHLLYQDMLTKRAEVQQLHSKGKNKYEYDSDEETEGGTWEHKLREKEMVATRTWAESLTEMAKGKHHIGDFLPPDELKRFMDKYTALKGGSQEPDLSDYKEYKLTEENKGFQMLQKLGWTEGQGLGSDGSGIVEPINKAKIRDTNQGLGITNPGDVDGDDDEYAAYRKRMMLAYRFRPNPLNNPRRPYY